MEFSDWINDKYVQWRGNAVGHERTITEFAGMIGVSSSLMTQWMQRGGKKPRNQSTISKLVAVFGYEVYDVLGIPHPAGLDALLEATRALSPDDQDELKQVINEWLIANGYRRVK
jgi:hypothetical protein